MLSFMFFILALFYSISLLSRLSNSLFFIVNNFGILFIVVTFLVLLSLFFYIVFSLYSFNGGLSLVLRLW